MEWLKFFAVFLFVFSGLVLAFYAGLMLINEIKFRARERAYQKRLAKYVFPR